MKKTLKSKNKNHSITKKYVTEKDLSEIDMDLYDDILGKNWDDLDDKYGRHERITLGEGRSGYRGETIPINIDRAIKVLESFKNKGCNYVELFYHCDHIGYEFYGLDIHRSTDDEIEDYTKKKELSNKKEISDRLKQLEIEKVNLQKQL